jgi:hypothetical protein
MNIKAPWKIDEDGMIRDADGLGLADLVVEWKGRGADRRVHILRSAPELYEALEHVIKAADDPDNQRDADLVNALNWEWLRSTLAAAKRKR